MNAWLQLNTASEPMLLIPSQALIDTGSEQRVITVDADRGWRGFVGLLSKAGIRGCKMLNNVRNVSVPIANGRSVFAQNR